MLRPPFWNDAKVEELIQLTLRAGVATLQVRETGGLNTQFKGDGSPVTCADHASQAIIIEGLRKLTPDIPIIAEENETNPCLRDSEACWLVDPLDGTREYVRGGPEYSVNIGLLIGGKPVLGVVFAPALDDLAYGDPDKVLRIQNKVRTDLSPPQAQASPLPPRLVTSAREGKRLPIDAWVEGKAIASWRLCHSAYKLSLVACNDVDFFLRAGLTYEWDTCAGHAILAAQGGHILTPDGDELTYGKTDYINGDFMAFRADMPKATTDHFLNELVTLGSPAPAKGIL